MNKTKIPDPLTGEEIEKLNRQVGYLKDGIPRMNNSFAQKLPQPDETNDQFIFDKNVADNIILMSKILTKMAKYNYDNEKGLTCVQYATFQQTLVIMNKTQ